MKVKVVDLNDKKAIQAIVESEVVAVFDSQRSPKGVASQQVLSSKEQMIESRPETKTEIGEFNQSRVIAEEKKDGPSAAYSDISGRLDKSNTDYRTETVLNMKKNSLANADESQMNMTDSTVQQVMERHIQSKDRSVPNQSMTSMHDN